MPDNILQFGINVILFLQNTFPWLSAPMKAASFLASKEFFLLLAPAIYWCVDSALGLRIMMYLMVNTELFAGLKILFHGPRPFWYDERVKALAIESSFGLPSGHSQNAMVAWGTLAVDSRKPWARRLAVLLVFVIGFSRLVLGMHFPTDVLTGWLIGFLVLTGLLTIEKPLIDWLDNQSLPVKICAAFLASLALIAMGWIVRAVQADWSMPALWIENIHRALPEIDPDAAFSLTDSLSSTGILFGLAVGAFITQKQGGFKADGARIQKTTRLAIGILGVIAIWGGLRAIFPSGETLVSMALRYLRYAIIGIWVSGAAPLLFIRLKLAGEIKNQDLA